jgi:hypothetical protein
MSSAAGLALTSTIEGDRLRATLENRSSSNLRIWARTNPWGWATLVLSIGREAAAADYTLTPAPEDWTRSGPGVIDIGPGEQQVFELSRDELEWENLSSIAHLENEEFYVRAELRIPRSKEAVELGVSIGRIVGEPVLSRPPHRWLFPRAGRR